MRITVSSDIFTLPNREVETSIRLCFARDGWCKCKCLVIDELAPSVDQSAECRALLLVAMLFILGTEPTRILGRHHRAVFRHIIASLFGRVESCPELGALYSEVWKCQRRGTVEYNNTVL